MNYPFRIERPAVVAAHGAGSTTNEYTEKLLKLIPAEVVALYQSIYSIVSTQTDWLGKTLLPILPLIGLVLVIFVRSWGTRNDKGEWRSVQGGAVIIAAVSFVVWVISLGHPVIYVPSLPQWLGGVVLIVAAFFVPYFYKP